MVESLFMHLYIYIYTTILLNAFSVSTKVNELGSVWVGANGHKQEEEGFTLRAQIRPRKDQTVFTGQRICLRKCACVLTTIRKEVGHAHTCLLCFIYVLIFNKSIYEKRGGRTNTPLGSYFLVRSGQLLNE